MQVYEQYPVQVEFTRLFTSGNLQGLTHTDRMGFITMADAKAWAWSVSSSVRTNYTITKLVNHKTGEDINFELEAR
jgi:hypothetical protein